MPLCVAAAWRHYGRRSLRLPQKLDGAAGFLNRLFQIFRHATLTPVIQDAARGRPLGGNIALRFYITPVRGKRRRGATSTRYAIAHRVSLGVNQGARRAAFAQIPLVLLMVGYTFTGLWVLGQVLAAP